MAIIVKKKDITDLLVWLEQEKLKGVEFVNKSVIAEEYLRHLEKKEKPEIGSGNTTDDLPF